MSCLPKNSGSYLKFAQMNSLHGQESFVLLLTICQSIQDHNRIPYPFGLAWVVRLNPSFVQAHWGYRNAAVYGHEEEPQ